MSMMQRKVEETNPIRSNPCRRLLAVLRVPRNHLGQVLRFPRYEQLIKFIFSLSFCNKPTPAQEAPLKHFAIQVRYLLVFGIQYKIIKLTIFIPTKVHVFLFQDHPT